MSCVALLKAISQKKNSVPCSQKSVGMVNATPPNAAPMSNCMDTTHHRLVFTTSMKGLHIGLMTQGRYSHEV